MGKHEIVGFCQKTCKFGDKPCADQKLTVSLAQNTLAERAAS